MSTVQRPPVASWLLKRFAGGSNRESLIGDIDEQFARGRSSFWYWRQVLLAILFGINRDLREHPLLAIRSVIVTWAVVIAWVESTWTLYLWVSDKWVYAWVNSSVVLFEFWIPFGGGLCLVWCVGSAVTGWASARLSDRNRTAFIAASMLAQVPLSLWWTRHFWLYGEFTTRVGPRLWVPNYLWAAVVLIGMPTSTILGALYGAMKFQSDRQFGDVPFRPR
jgi:hypothetical protein